MPPLNTWPLALEWIWGGGERGKDEVDQMSKQASIPVAREEVERHQKISASEVNYKRKSAPIRAAGGSNQQTSRLVSLPPFQFWLSLWQFQLASWSDQPCQSGPRWAENGKP